MTKIVRDTSLVLRSIRYKESSLIVTVFARKFGKLKLLARGARRPKSIFGSSLEPFTYVRLIFYRRESKEIYNLSETEILDSFPRARNSLRKVIATNAFCEFLDKTLAPEQPNPRLFSLTVQSLGMVAGYNLPNQISAIVYSFLWLAFGLLGFKPHLTNCVRCGKKSTNLFSIKYGGLVCSRNEDKNGIPLPPSTIAELQELYLNLTPRIHYKHPDVVENLAKNYMLYHLESTELRTLRFFQNKGLLLE